MHTKTFEIRDKGTFIPVIATLMVPTEEADGFLLYRSGFRGAPVELVMLCRMDANGVRNCASYDPFSWDNRTMGTAHQHIEQNWDSLRSGDVIDVEFILNETQKPKKSERFE